MNDGKMAMNEEWDVGTKSNKGKGTRPDDSRTSPMEGRSLNASKSPNNSNVLSHFDKAAFSKFCVKGQPGNKVKANGKETTPTDKIGNKGKSFPVEEPTLNKLENTNSALEFSKNQFPPLADAKTKDSEEINIPASPAQLPPSDNFANAESEHEEMKDVVDDLETLKDIFKMDANPNAYQSGALNQYPMFGATSTTRMPSSKLFTRADDILFRRSLDWQEKNSSPMALTARNPYENNGGGYPTVFGGTWNGEVRDMHNTSWTTSASLGNLEKNDFVLYSNNSAKYLKQEMAAGGFQSDMTGDADPAFNRTFSANQPMFFGYMPQPPPQGVNYMSGGFPMMPMGMNGGYNMPAPYGNGYMPYQPQQSDMNYDVNHQRRFSLEQGTNVNGGNIDRIQNGQGVNRNQQQRKQRFNDNTRQLNNRCFVQKNNGDSSFSQNNNDRLFEIFPDKIEMDSRTTLMVKNIPNKYNLPLMLETINKNHKGKFDFFYLPIDFRNNCNVGYAFINFIDTRFIRPFYEEFNGKKWEKFNSEKICVIKYARIQGREDLINHFEYSSVMSQTDKKLKPMILKQCDLATIEVLVQQQKAKTTSKE